MSSSTKFTSLTELKPCKTSWRIRVKVLHFWIQSFKEKIVSLEIADEDGNKIQASIKKDLFSKFQKHIKKDEWITLQEFSLLTSKGQYRATSHQYKISFLYTTIVSPTAQLSNNIWLNLANFDDIINGSLDQSILIDVLGQLVNVGEMKTVEVKGKDTSKIDFELRNINDIRLPCTLWSKFAEQIYQVSQKSIGCVVFCLIRWGKLCLYGDIRSVSNAFDASEVFINPHLPEVDQFKQLIPSDGIGLSCMDSKPLNKSVITTEEVGTEYPLKTVAYLLEKSKIEKVRIMCTIQSIDTDWSWYYFSCRKCNKKVYKSTINSSLDQKSLLYWCEKCQKDVSSIVPRYLLHLNIIDHTGETNILLFDSIVQQITGQTAGSLLDSSYDQVEDPQPLPLVVKNIIGKTYQFLVNVEDENNYKPNDIFKVTKVILNNGTNEEFSTRTSDIPSESSSDFSGEPVLMLTNSLNKNPSIASTPSSKRKENIPDQSSSTKRRCSLERNFINIDENDGILDELMEKNHFNNVMEDVGEEDVIKSYEKKNIPLKNIKIEKD